jgi:Flp pilus assembly pilin Flp
MELFAYRISAMIAPLAARMRVESGQTLAEYGILLGVIAVVVVTVAVLLGSNISDLFSSVSHHV